MNAGSLLSPRVGVKEEAGCVQDSPVSSFLCVKEEPGSVPDRQVSSFLANGESLEALKTSVKQEEVVKFLPELSDDSGDGSSDSSDEDEEASTGSGRSETSSALSFTSSREYFDQAPAPSGPQPDDFFYCDTCEDWVLDGCLDHPPSFLEDDQSKTSGLPSCLGYFSTGEVQAKENIPQNSLFGPMTGKTVESFVAEKIDALPYLWEVKKFNGKSVYFVPEEGKQAQHWMHLVEAASSMSSQNLIAVQFKGDVYYKTIVPITAGTTLKVGRAEGLPWVKGIPLEAMVTRYGQHVCSLCPACFDSKQDLKRHVYGERHKPIDDLVCRKCGQHHTSRHNLRVHMYRKHQLKPFPCPLCKVACASDRGLKLHFRSHFNKEKKRRPCPKCDKSFSTRQHLWNHMATHGAPQFHCDKCGTYLKSEDSLKNHMESKHSDGNKMYLCDFPGCGKSFSTALYLKGHTKRVHIRPKEPKIPKPSESSFPCRYCDLVYGFQNSRSRHERKYHLEEIEKKKAGETRKFNCELCSARFQSRRDLEHHTMRHTGNFPFNCDRCDKGYPTGRELATHKARAHETDELEKALAAKGLISVTDSPS